MNGLNCRYSNRIIVFLWDLTADCEGSDLFSHVGDGGVQAMLAEVNPRQPQVGFMAEVPGWEAAFGKLLGVYLIAEVVMGVHVAEDGKPERNCCTDAGLERM